MRNELSEKNWKLIALVSLGVVLLLLVLIAGRAVWQFLLPGHNVIQRAHTALVKIERQNQLAATRAFVQAVVRQRNEAWYGNAEVIRIVPATVHYAVNLNEIDLTQLEYDEKSRVLYVGLPDVKVLAIDPDLAHAETIRSLDLLRTEGGAGNPLEDATEKMVRPALEKVATSPEALKTAKEHAVFAVKQLLETVFSAAGDKVEVRPYFKSEGKALAQR